MGWFGSAAWLDVLNNSEQSRASCNNNSGLMETQKQVAAIGIVGKFLLTESKGGAIVRHRCYMQATVRLHNPAREHAS
jgi:hypothetical protein